MCWQWLTPGCNVVKSLRDESSSGLVVRHITMTKQRKAFNTSRWHSEKRFVPQRPVVLDSEKSCAVRNKCSLNLYLAKVYAASGREQSTSYVCEHGQQQMWRKQIATAIPGKQMAAAIPRRQIATAISRNVPSQQGRWGRNRIRLLRRLALRGETTRPRRSLVEQTPKHQIHPWKKKAAC